MTEPMEFVNRDPVSLASLGWGGDCPGDLPEL